MRHLKSGFTLIELLVVMAILGILALGIIVAIDPIEQINRATDSNMQNLARQFISASSQYQTSNSFSPACPDKTCATYNDSISSSATVPLSSLTTVNGTLAAAGNTSTNDSFIHHAQAPSISVSLTNITPASDATFILCWRPLSKVQRSRANVNDNSTAIYNNMGVAQPAASCPADNTNTCYQCLKQ